METDLSFVKKNKRRDDNEPEKTWKIEGSIKPDFPITKKGIEREVEKLRKQENSKRKTNG